MYLLHLISLTNERSCSFTQENQNSSLSSPTGKSSYQIFVIVIGAADCVLEHSGVVAFSFFPGQKLCAPDNTKIYKLTPCILEPGPNERRSSQ